MKRSLCLALLLFCCNGAASAQTAETQMSQQEHNKLEKLLNKVDQRNQWGPMPTPAPQEPANANAPALWPRPQNEAYGQPNYREQNYQPQQQQVTNPTQELGSFLTKFGSQYAAPLQSALSAVHVQQPGQPNSPWLTNMLHFFTPAARLRGTPVARVLTQNQIPGAPEYGTVNPPYMQSPPPYETSAPAPYMPPSQTGALPGDSQPMGYDQIPQGPQNPFNLTPFGMLHYIWDDTKYVSESNPVSLYEVQNDLQAVQHESALARSAANRARYAQSPQERAEAAQQAQYYANLANQYAQRARVTAGEGSLNPADVANMATQEAANAQTTANGAVRNAYGSF